MYQPGQAAPVISPEAVASVAGVSGWHSSAIFDDCRYASPHMMAVTQAA